MHTFSSKRNGPRVMKRHTKRWGGKRHGAGPKIKSAKLSQAEMMLVIDALNGVIVDPANAHWQIPSEIEDAIRLNRLDTKWNVDGAGLVEKLKKLSPAAANELTSNVDKFWQRA